MMDHIDPVGNQGHYNAEGNLRHGKGFAEACKPFLARQF